MTLLSGITLISVYLCMMMGFIPLFLESLGGGELMVIILFILIFFGSKRIPDLARGLGRGMREFRDAMQGVQHEIRQGIQDVEKIVPNDNLSIENKKPEDENPAGSATSGE